MAAFLFEQRILELTPAIEKFKRMPTNYELKKMGLNSLAVHISKNGGYRQWATVLGIPLKDTNTRFGHDWEYSEVKYFESLGYDVKKMGSSAPYDLLVGKMRVDVKAAHRHKSGARWEGFAWAGLKNGVDCDFFDLLAIEGDKIIRRYFIPAKKLEKQTLTITVWGFNKPDHWTREFIKDTPI